MDGVIPGACRIILVFSQGEPLTMPEKGRKPDANAGAVDPLAAVLDHLDQGFLLLGPDLTIRAANQAHRDIFGYPKRLMRPGTPVREVIRFLAKAGVYGPGEVDALVEKRLKALKKKAWQDEELPLPDGRVIEIHRALLPDGGKVAVATDVTAHHRAAAALKKSEERFRDYAETASDWLWEMDETLRFSYFSDRNRQALGGDLKAAIGKTRGEMAADRLDSAAWQAHLADLAAHRPFRDFTYEIRTGPKTSRHISISGKPIFGPDGEFQGYRGSGRDVTTEKERERSLRHSVSLLQATFDATADGIMVVDPVRFILHGWNRRLVEMFEIPERVLATKDSRKVRDWIARHLVAPDRYIADTRRRFAHPDEEYQSTLETKDGRIIERHTRPQVLGGEIVGRVVSLRDVTANVRAAEQIEAQKSLLETVFRDVPDAMVLVDQHRCITMCNPAFAQVFGYDEGEAMGQKASLMYASREEFKRHGLLRYHPGAPERQTPHVVTYRRKNGETFPGETVGSLLRDGDGTIIGFVGVIRDVSLRLLAEADRRRALELAEDANRAKSAFLANVSHDLRTPLNAILGFAEIMNQEILGPLGHAKYLEYVEDIRDSGQYLLSLVNDLLDISTIEAGKRHLSRENIDVADLIRECVKAAASRTADGRAAVKASVAKDLPPLNADRRAMKQIILNLLSNAIKFTPETGRITLAARRRGGRFEISVKDTGKGIPRKNLSRITTAFERGQTDAYSTADGTGLGLAITRSLVEMHGGDLEIQSEVGKGTSVRVNIPA